MIERKRNADTASAWLTALALLGWIIELKKLGAF